MKLLSEFAARWRKELDPETVKQGRENRKNTATTPKNKRHSWDYLNQEDAARKKRMQIESYREYKSKNNPGFNGKVISPEELKNNKKRKNKLKVAVNKNKYRRDPVKARYYPINGWDDKGNKVRMYEVDTGPRRGQIRIDTKSPSISSNNSRQAFNQRLQSVGKSAMKKELLGVAAISGVIGGIALARKVRSDKNKKRGKYRRF